ncbi:DUF262 domain-containing protein [Brachyspira catarrhinii]|uniref:DUF262 domain-containing protein n=1 Tax=Brachyspira catarrhinii TaxID=2528966 RepID=A0ABY2TQ23_9SPIR|nr:DUF262 domain-containing protein [Brachyspira catarrhinii]TKZ34320.1 DUF262 domain-containing protein [Brachyspira catarrhinii]
MNLSELLNNELIIPEIQRDYVWGNNEIVLRRFLKNIFNNINNDKENKLDIGFFYSYKVYQNEEIYALIDGQQRITTLVLLYWYIGIGEDYIKKFKFKVRENCNNFLEKLLEENISKIGKINGESISERIKNCIWYLSIWDNDPTVKSMLKALDIIEYEFNKITENKEDIKNNIKSNIEQNIIFTCITNDDRGLEKEYISLNARGRELEKYEKLKAILVEDMDNKKVEDMKDEKKKYEYLEKWEKDWQDILWECKGDNVYNTDNIWNAVLYWARDIFVIENNICKPDTEKEEIYFDFDLMSIKGKNDKGENYKDILLKIFDWIIPALKIINENKDLFQKKCQFNDKKVIDIDKIIEGDKKESYKLTDGQRALFYGLLYLVKNEDKEILEKIRVFRNLIENSNINSDNLVASAVKSLELLSKKTISDFPNKLLDNNKEIKGISPEQKYEEALKLEIFNKYSNYKETILKIENDALFKGRIKNIFLLAYSENNEDFINKYNLHTKFFEEIFFDKKEDKLELKENIISKSEEKLKLFDNLLEQYIEIYGKKNEIWGELLLDKNIYIYYNHMIVLKDSSLNEAEKEKRAFLYLVYLYHNNKSTSIDKFLDENRKSNLKNILETEKETKIIAIKDPINQLYIIYLLYDMKKEYLFQRYTKHFGVLEDDEGYYGIPKEKKEEKDNSPFNEKFLFQTYNICWNVGGAQPYVKFDSASDLSGLENIYR